MKALSIRQPWASLICGGFPVTQAVQNDDGSTRVELSGKVILKDIENRTWPTGFRGRIQVHAGKRVDAGALDWLMHKGFPPGVALLFFGSSVPRGAIIGEVDILDCVTQSESPWFTGPYGFQLANPSLYETPIACKGRLGFFTPHLA